MSNLIIGVLGLILLAILLRHLFSHKLNRSDESIVLESAKANGWTDVVIASKSMEFSNFRLEKITNNFIVDFTDERGVPRRSTCSVNSGNATWED